MASVIAVVSLLLRGGSELVTLEAASPAAELLKWCTYSTEWYTHSTF